MVAARKPMQATPRTTVTTSRAACAVLTVEHWLAACWSRAWANSPMPLLHVLASCPISSDRKSPSAARTPNTTVIAVSTDPPRRCGCWIWGIDCQGCPYPGGGPKLPGGGGGGGGNGPCPYGPCGG